MIVGREDANVHIAFILFRQHQQASIIAQNPGIPNPEVSKIIGEQWRGLSAEAKEEWNLLAEVRWNKDYYH
jgi:HMG box factor